LGLTLPLQAHAAHPRPVGATANTSYNFARMTPFTQGVFASQNRMNSFTWPNRLDGSCCSAALQYFRQ